MTMAAFGIRITVGIFSLFGKKETPPARKPAARPAQKKRSETASGPDTKAPPDRSQMQRKAARAATAMKIDEIESEMSSEFVKPLPFSGNTMPGPISQFADTNTRRAPDTLAPNTAAAPGKDGNTVPLEQLSQPLPEMGESTAFLLGEDTVLRPVALSSSEAPPVVEEAAILFANGQVKLVEPILQHAVEEEAPPAVWGMLFDLYQITGQRAAFEHLSIQYAHKFEMSPPGWVEGDAGMPAKDAGTPRPGTTPTIPFSGKLDAGIVKQLERVRNVADISPSLKLEFGRVSEVDPIGCGLLLNVLTKLQKSGHTLVLAGAADLTEKIQSILAVGRRDETDAPWLLLLELLRLQNREAEFEERSIDYCVTFEVSPPAFVPPQDKVTTTSEESASDGTDEGRFPMPTVVDGTVAPLLQQITTYAQAHEHVVLDCSGLTRMDFSAAGQLFNGLAPLSAAGKRIELHHPNHFIVALCGVMGVLDMLRIVQRKA